VVFWVEDGRWICPLVRPFLQQFPLLNRPFLFPLPFPLQLDSEQIFPQVQLSLDCWTMNLGCSQALCLDRQAFPSRLDFARIVPD
jgi:hypothetical protein